MLDRLPELDRSADPTPPLLAWAGGPDGRSLLDHAVDGLLLLDATGRCLDANARACEMLGYEREALLARSYAELLTAEELAARPLRFDDLERDRRIVTERRFHCADGTVLDVEVGTTLLGGGRILAAVRDVSARVAAEAARRESETLFRHAFDYAGIGMALIALDGRCMKVNAAFCAMLGYSAAELLARDFQSITHPDDLAADLSAAMRLVAGAASSYCAEKRYVHRDGRIIWGQLNVSLVRDALGRPLHFISQVVDVTALREAEERLRALAVVDELTGLLNRRGFRQGAERQLAVARRAQLPMLLMYLDLDRFKELNDTHGHAEGDAALAAVGQLLRATLRDADVVGRIGGDEFAALALNRTDETLEAVTARITRQIEQVNARGRWPEPLRVSIGAVRFDPDAPVALDELLRQADAALYENKRARRAARGAT